MLVGRRLIGGEYVVECMVFADITTTCLIGVAVGTSVALADEPTRAVEMPAITPASASPAVIASVKGAARPRRVRRRVIALLSWVEWVVATGRRPRELGAASYPGRALEWLARQSP